MFYSHESEEPPRAPDPKPLAQSPKLTAVIVLNSSQYGVATIWLVATIGKGPQKRLPRKSIQEVNVPKACEKILDPGAPLALRLQGSLLYGVSRVFSQQCGYVLSDAEKTQSDMMTFFRVMKTSDVDPKAGKTKRRNIILEDDPAFDPFSAVPNLDFLNNDKDYFIHTSQGSAGSFSQMTPLGTSQGSSSCGRNASLLDFDFDHSLHSAGSYRLPSHLGHPSSPSRKPGYGQDNMPDFIPFVDDEFDPIGGIALDFDADGNLIGIIEPEPELPPFPGSPLERFCHDQTHHRQPVEEAEYGVLQDGDGMVLDMGEPALPDADALLSRPAGKQATASDHNPTSTTTETEEAVAPARQAPRRKLQLMLDRNDTLSTAEIRRRDHDYAEHMQAARKRQKTTHAQAKINAMAFVYDNGLAHVGSLMAANSEHPLLAAFSGVGLKARLQGRFPDASDYEPKKQRGRPRKVIKTLVDHHGEEENGNMRQGEDEDAERGRGGLNNLGEYLAFGDDTAPELGMEAAAAMDDHYSSSMNPWSRAASAIPGSSIRGGQGSAQKPGPSPSPLHGRGSILNSIERHSDPLGPGNLLSQENSSHFGFEPIANIDFGRGSETQPAPAEGDGLDIASQQFLDYAVDKAKEKGASSSDLAGERHGRRWVEFTEFADKKKHTPAVAAQAFMHILSLASKSIISVRQDGVEENEPFGIIRVGVDVGTSLDNNEHEDELA